MPRKIRTDISKEVKLKTMRINPVL